MKAEQSAILNWLLEGDPAVVYQAHRDLLDTDSPQLKRLQRKITASGWGRGFLDRCDPQTGLWGNGYYGPKWISTTYTLLDLKNLGVSPAVKELVTGSRMLLERLWNIPRKPRERHQDLCICGMLLNLGCYAGIEPPKLNEIIDYVLAKQFADGGWNCRWQTDKDHGSLHTTINVLEGLCEYLEHGYAYQNKQVAAAIPKAHEFILMHKLYKSDKTGRVIDHKMTMLSYPSRWRYDILRALDYFRAAGQPYDGRMDDALDVIINKKRFKTNLWPVQQKYSGLVHFDMEQPGRPSRLNTLRVLRVLKKYREEEFKNALHKE